MLSTAGPTQFVTGAVSTYAQEKIANNAFSKVYRGFLATQAVGIENTWQGNNESWIGVFVSTGDRPWIRADALDVDRSICPWIAQTEPDQYVGLPVTFQIWVDNCGGRYAFNVNPA